MASEMVALSTTGFLLRQLTIPCVGALLLMVACSSPQTTTVPSCRGPVAYGDEPKQDLDIYQANRANAPVLIFYHGGAWRSGDKSELEDFGQTLADQGITVVVPNYRSALEEHRFPAQVIDAADAFKWTKSHIGLCGADPDRIFVGGHSAGAHLAALLAIDRHWRKRAGIDDDDLAGVVSIGGIFKIEAVDGGFPRALVESVFGSQEDDWAKASPLTIVKEEASLARRQPFLIFFGEREASLTKFESQRWATALEAEGATPCTIVIPSADHTTALAALFEEGSGANSAVLEFITGEATSSAGATDNCAGAGRS